jgi:hypothetical protein
VETAAGVNVGASAAGGSGARPSDDEAAPDEKLKPRGIGV